jgi:CBS domain-containing protein
VKEKAMNVRDIMTSAPLTCGPSTNLAAAAQLMLEGDCGLLPVVDEDRLIGVVTDRDLFIAMATRNMRAPEMTVGDVVQAPVHTCGPDEDVHEALALMQRHSVRRLPVEGVGGTVLGVISMNDILLHAGPIAHVRPEEIVETFQAICAHAHRPPQVAA